MVSEQNNPRITPVLRGLTAIEALVLIVTGGGLFFLTDAARAQWPWPILWYATRVIGATYLASLAAVACMLIYGRWSPARLVLALILTFTTVILVLSLAYLPVFDFKRWSTWGWFILYILLPISAAYHLWLYRRILPPDPIPTPRIWQLYLFVQGLVAAILGVGILIAPDQFNSMWPGTFDRFHGQLYSAMYFTAMTGSWIVARSATRAEWLTLGLTQSVLGGFMLLGAYVVKAALGPDYQLTWSPLGSVVWLGFFGLMLLTGIVMLLQSLARRHTSTSIQSPS
jgi:hypothetical protein